ncbi:hypothetical protein Tco_0530183 [Tanacetum coccineum]
MVKFIFHLLDLSSGTILLYQKLLEFTPGNRVQASSILIVGQKIPTRIESSSISTSSIKLHLVVIGIVLLQENTDSVCSNQWISPTAPSEPLKLIAYASRAVVTLTATSFP